MYTYRNPPISPPPLARLQRHRSEVWQEEAEGAYWRFQVQVQWFYCGISRTPRGVILCKQRGISTKSKNDPARMQYQSTEYTLPNANTRTLVQKRRFTFPFYSWRICTSCNMRLSSSFVHFNVGLDYLTSLVFGHMYEAASGVHMYVVSRNNKLHCKFVENSND